MRRTGSSAAALLALVLAVAGSLGVAGPAWAGAPEFTQRVDRSEVGTQDTFRLIVEAVDAPDDAQVQFPPPEDFEVLSSSQSTQRSIQLSGNGPPVLQETRRYTLILRATRSGTLTIPPATLVAGDRSWRTQPVRIRVREGHIPDPRAAAQSNDPFAGFPGFPPDMDEALRMPEVRIPRGDSDLFLRASLDKDEVYVGEQTTLSLYIFSRVDLSSVDAVTMPKLEGFWSEDVESPSQLSGEQRIVDGVPYRAYLLRRRALFPVKAGELSISAAEADITTGFLFAGHRVHRVSNPLTVKVKPLPPGAPPGMQSANVGQWRLTVEASPTRVELGQPVTVRVTLEGVGNVKNVTPPRLTGPAPLRIFDPTTTDRMAPGRNRVQGVRMHEYLVMPQQTGTFTLPALAFPFFDPKARRYEVSRTDPVRITVEPGAGGASSSTPSAPRADADGAKNVLTGGGLRPLRHQATFSAPSAPLWLHPLFLPAVLAPLVLWLGAALFGLARGRLRAADAGGASQRQAREARRRLAAAQALAGEGAPAQAFYTEVERALQGFLEARLRTPVLGLTREALDAQLAQSGVDAERRARVRSVLDACDAGRFAPGAELAGRERVLSDAAAVMEGWDR
ncbi:protein BatD [Aggregicoccus sp. 17bor-14]|uniref:BatD family protein n=1 Tax=Myxococcaceae TaxID=31 RepID=UPI00129C14E7|nr:MULTISPECIES: BatD family protein [Myxococcaceae]MBF5044361.1 protein BatD [Simulacricoccus sp. 17bor-14]MRI90108.1 protein BatD [Aggregicoccus sp. 17bor-14]